MCSAEISHFSTIMCQRNMKLRQAVESSMPLISKGTAECKTFSAIPQSVSITNIQDQRCYIALVQGSAQLGYMAQLVIRSKRKS